ncbi:hypothetical protein [Shewanella acanthi]|uniref:hypothetical protein n=1 Tax=Shewanella acanthi TaxID=2864212 RepID=UPI001C6617D2|nr:hypothetical protein [Shewanella acanthi]QYJ79705.1 hypothetical protein K0H61_04520 [Shewanella acanthi]
MRRKSLLKEASIALAITASMAMALPASAMKLQPYNLQKLTSDSQSIITGEVIKMTDGFDNNRPYTEITIAVAEDAKGKLKKDSTYTFRQFGLIKPRAMGNGKVYLGVTPEGFAKWNVGENVVAFMYKPASITGFQTTAGMAQGKFVVRDGKVMNEFANIGLFENMNPTDISEENRNMLSNPNGVDLSIFMNLVTKMAGGQQ